MGSTVIGEIVSGEERVTRAQRTAQLLAPRAKVRVLYVQCLAYQGKAVGVEAVGTEGQNNVAGAGSGVVDVNDIICCGAKPLFFLDYIAIGKNEPEKVASIILIEAAACNMADAVDICGLDGGQYGLPLSTPRPAGS